MCRHDCWKQCFALQNIFILLLSSLTMENFSTSTLDVLIFGRCLRFSEIIMAKLSAILALLFVGTASAFAPASFGSHARR